MKITFLLAGVTLALVANGTPFVRGAEDVELFKDDFSRFPPGLLSAPIGQLNGAIQEYHYIEHRGVAVHPWRNPIVHLDSWAAGDESGRPYLEQHTVNLEPERVTPLFVAGDPEWRDYRVDVLVRPLSLEKEAGLVFRYQTSRSYYRLALEQGTRRGDAFDQISCLTAVTLDGRVLWQQGRPNPKNGLLTNDTPFQIHDLDGDGRAEVVLARDFQLQVLDGRTGRLLRSTWLPPLAADLKDRPYELNVGDSLLFVDLSGGGAPREILLKDRYRSFWIFDKDLKLLWQGQGQTGHYPYPVDIDGDGRQEFVIGYSLWDAEETRRWSHDAAFRDHADALSVGNFTGRPSAGMRAYIDGSDEGFLVFESDGTLVKHLRLGHAQTQSVGAYRSDLAGLQLLIATFWRNPGIVTLLDADANILAQEEMIPGSSHLEPVNWRGDGQEFALLSGNIREGGMIDGRLRRVVMFPDDGHPDLASAVRDVTGDERDEVILWDQARVWIYTQDRSFSGTRIYKPVRNPDYNDSNYRSTVSLPGWAPAPGSAPNGRAPGGSH